MQDRIYSEWGDWESCSATCGGGTMKRTRTCTDPTNGGAACVGLTEETVNCNNFVCPDSKYSTIATFNTVIVNMPKTRD